MQFVSLLSMSFSISAFFKTHLLQVKLDGQASVYLEDPLQDFFFLQYFLLLVCGRSKPICALNLHEKFLLLCWIKYFTYSVKARNVADSSRHLFTNTCSLWHIDFEAFQVSNLYNKVDLRSVLNKCSFRVLMIWGDDQILLYYT